LIRILEDALSPYINPENAGKQRNQLTRGTVLALRELMKQTEPNQTSLDLVAFITIALEQISKTVEESVTAWEKRGYWVKADRFRLEWEWAARASDRLLEALKKGDWASIAINSAQVGQKLMSVKLPIHNRLGTPWVGAWEKLKKDKGIK
jgi:hypothetical protein